MVMRLKSVGKGVVLLRLHVKGGQQLREDG